MDVQWTSENIEEQANAELGTDLADAAVLFPRVVYSTYVQLMNGNFEETPIYSTEEFRRRVCQSLPSSVPEVLPFFVRTVWNRKWTYESHQSDILNLANQYVRLLSNAGHSLSSDEIVRECRSAFSNWQS
jgi:hypothetical protein